MADLLERARAKKALIARAKRNALIKRVKAIRAARLMGDKLNEPQAPPKRPRPPQQKVAPRMSMDARRDRARLLADPGQYAEINRIIGLELVPSMTDEEVEEFNSKRVLARPYADGFRMWRVQCEAIRSYEQRNGLFAPIGVGWGKTMVTQAIAASAFRRGLKRVLLLVPSSVLGQLVRDDFPFARRRIDVNYPIHVMGGKPPGARRMLATSGKRGLYILPYSCLSTKDTSEVLEAMAPELIIADEADALGNPRAARTKRLMGYVREHGPQGCVLSGTITSKTIKDYYHLIRWCLGEYCPLPLAANLASEWATKIDSDACSSEATGPIMPLVHWAERNFPAETISEDTAGFRMAYKLRLKSCPGVTATGDAEIKPSLVIHNQPVKSPSTHEGWAELTRLQKQVVELWRTPNEDEIEHPIHTYKWLYELSAGFYNELTFPTPEQFAERSDVSESVAEEILDLAREHHGAGQEYSSELRKWIEDHGRSGLDTPMLVGHDMSTHGGANVGTGLYRLWADHKVLAVELRELILEKRAFKGASKELDRRITRSLRNDRVVRVCDYKIRHAVKWASSLKKDQGAIMWIYHKGMGVWLTEALREAGLDPLHCPAGAAANAAILDPKNRGRKIVASMRSHGTGKNLQAFNQELFVQWPRSAKLAEQTLGRMHRNGQEASQVSAYTCATSEFDDMLLAASLNDALYIHQTTGNRQKLIYATYAPHLPKVFPTAVLRERGFQNKKLSTAAQALMTDRFG